MNHSGAARLQKVINGLQARGALNGVSLRGPTNNVLWIEKRTGESEARTEFTFQLRIERLGNKEIWWPIAYSSAGGDSINCELVSNGKTLTNFVKQDALIDLAESWAKTLEAELVTKTIDNALR